MTSRLDAVCIDANDPTGLARFWAGVLDREVGADGVVVPPRGDVAFGLLFQPTHERKSRANRLHFDLTSGSLEEQQQIVTRSLELGARHIDVGQRPEEGQVVLADPEGNEFCVIEPGNAFLADCGTVGALNWDGSQEAGYFWSEALAWPLVWDQDEETAIQSPDGGTKIAWGGPPVALKAGKNRWHLHLEPTDGDQEAEVDRLVSLGASRLGVGRSDVGGVVMADPDGNEFCVLPPRRP